VVSLRGAELEALVAEAVVDCYDADEQLGGLFTMIEDNLAVPFTTQVLGVEVTVRKVDLRGGGIVAVCHRGRVRQAIGILDLPLPAPPVPLLVKGSWQSCFRLLGGGSGL
jgi:hypothetical protein